MKLRSRLFLWVGAIFLVAFGISLFLEIRLTNQNLQDSEDQLKQKILQTNEKSRKYVENYLQTAISTEKSQIDAVFLRIEDDFSSIHGNSWAILGQLFLQNNWIDFAQVTKADQLEALLLPLNTTMKSAKEERIDDLVSWIIIEEQVYLSIPVPNSSYFSKEKVQAMKLLFLPQVLQKMQPTGSLALDRAIALAKNAPRPNSEIGSNPKEIQSSCLSVENANSQVLHYLERPEQAEMIAAYTAIFPDPHLGNSPLAATAPQGIAKIAKGEGVALFSRDIFYSQALFDASSYMQAQASTHPGCKIGNKLAVIALQSHKISIANAMQVADNLFLSIGMGIEEIAKTLSLTLHKEILIVHKGKIIGEYTHFGNNEETFQLQPAMLNQVSGLVTQQEQTFYYLRLQPFQDLDLYFYVLTPQKEAFSLVDSLDENARKIVDKLSWNMRAIALCAFIFVLGLLHNIARRITRPITQLAKATEKVAAGKLEGISLPPIPIGRHDEVASLCHSFEKMVVDLKEKEKVKGVLNKVVSQEIAKEILKGTIHLGGEVRKVTVLFADIRHFTQMTTQLSPEEIVTLLNTCMTKISHVIDEHGGVIDKYVGDEVMALFGAPIDHGDSALRAIRSALEMVQVLQAWNAERSEEGLFSVEMGIGIHSGEALAGNMGAENRLNYTVIGSSVNLASRLCGIAQGMQILISKETLQEPHVREKVSVQQMPPAELKGFEGKISIYQVNS